MRVAGVEDAIGGMAGGIAHIMREIDSTGHKTNVDAPVQAPGNNNRDASQRVDVATSNPERGQQCASHTNCQEHAPPPPPVVTPCTERSMPIPVNLDSTSAGSGEHSTPVPVNLDSTSVTSTDVAAFDCRKRSPESHRRTVHSQPRARVVPCRTKLPDVMTPVHYDDPICTPPRMRPRSNSVRCLALFAHLVAFGARFQLSKTCIVCVAQDPIRPGTRIWVLHPAVKGQVVAEAKAGVNMKSRSTHKQLVARCKVGQQFILLKKIYRSDTPLLFPNDPNVGPNKMCDAYVWNAGNPEQWVRWWSRLLIDITDEEVC